VGSRGEQHQREKKVPHDVGLEQQNARVAMLGRTLVRRQQRDSVRTRRRSDMTWD
jgi:hypothetical protein